jgi:glycerol dehydrogenase
MIDVITPKHYLNKPGALAEAGRLISPIAKKVYIVGSKTALAVAGPVLLGSLNESGVEYLVFEYNGYPTRETAAEILKNAKQFGAQALVALGGGRIMDTTKTAGGLGDLPVIAVPTIAATCAPWAAVTILYNGEGEFTEGLMHKQSPLLIISDTDIIAKAPLRYLRSGIGDTLAKWYEVAPSLRFSKNLYLRLAVKYGELAREVLEEKGLDVAADLKRSVYNSDDVIEVIDAVFLLAGLCGAIRSINEMQSIAHPLYNAFSYIPELRSKLHGEKVSFGLLVQGVLENQSREELDNRLAVFSELELPITLEDLGLTENVDAKLTKVTTLVVGMVKDFKGLDKPFTPELLQDAIKTVDRLGHEYREKLFQKAV